MKRICICGSGTMGSGIATLTAMTDFYTILYDHDVKMLESAKIKISQNLQTLVEKGKITHEKKQKVLSQIIFTSKIEDCKCNLIIEAIVENKEAKTNLFNRLSFVNDSETIYTSNTSSISINEISELLTINRENFAGLHFFNPVMVMKLVEVISGKYTSPGIIDMLSAFAKKLGKEPVHCHDSPGFIVNRVARPYYIEPLRILESGIAEIHQIDRILEASGFKMGPFRLMDLIGNDINYAVSCSVYKQLKSPARLKPSLIQKQKVENGELGLKSGKGYYNYN